MNTSTTVRHLRSLLLPFLMVVVVPWWLLTSDTVGDTRWVAGMPMFWVGRLTGAVLFAAGLALFSWCIRLFMRVGQGTLAPWDPTRNLVASGPYQYVRNPMISSVTMMLVGQAIFWGSARMGFYLAVFVLVNHIYFVLSEEPGLERRFGEKYRSYKAHVPRWVPRFKPWTGEELREDK
jgi:protein-S-isoprenylcysteine O-methyltransferase Ste14